MPSFYQHVILAVFAGFLVLLVGAPKYAPLLLVFFMAAVFPDLDSKNSTVRKTLSMVIPAALSFFVVLKYGQDLPTRISAGLVAFFASRMAMAALPLSHRGKRSLHRPFLMLPVSVLLGLAVWIAFKTPDLWQLMAAALLGYATHIIADRMFGRR